MLDCFRSGGANSPETFVTAVAATLSRYPDEVIYAVTDPMTGLPSQLTFMPTIKDVRDSCEAAFLPIRTQNERERRVAEQMEARRREDEAKERRPSYDELKAKYGPDWGLSDATKKTGKPPEPAPTADQLRHHYQHYDLSFKPKNHDDLEDHINRGFSPGSI